MAQGLESLLTGHTLVKRYQIEEVIGRGGFAVVYRAMDTRLSRPVAVKVITLTATDPEHRETLRQRLHKEAQAAASLPHHPNLVTVHDVGTDPELGLDFLVMEMLRGENLSQALSTGGKPPLDRALCILRDTAQGLAVGHRAGLIHRDVKPGNIFLAEGIEGNHDDVRVCLLDYGIAQAIEDDQTVTRGMGANPLSPAFASPEQVRGDRNLSAATDVFSLGVVGYQLLTGERPFTSEPGQLPTGWTVRKPIRELNPEVPPQVEQVVMKAMSVEPGDRYPDADHFGQALAAATHQPLQSRVHAALAHVAVPPPVIDSEEDDGTVISPAPAALHVVPPAVEDDDGTVIAPAPAHPRPAAHASTRAHTVPSTAATRPKRRWPVVLVVALLLVAAAAWAAMSGGGGREDPNVNAVLPGDESGEAPSASEGGVVAPQPQPDAPLSREGTGLGGDQPSSPAEGGGVPAFEGQPSGSRPSGGAQPQPSGGQPRVSQPSAGQPQQPQPQRPTVTQPQRPAVTQPQPQQPQRPPVQQQPPVSRPQPQPQNPPAQQPPVQQPPVQQQPPAQQQPTQPQPRPDPPLLGRPVEPTPAPTPPPAPNPNAPRDTIRIGNPPR
ncbi:serine/threonine-protein kinase [Longimicrobium sp.]|uniref:serine/threonine-protein kinase n=1 Tax=Longimicrobium sp. TaxID=2029185 RepID=UPI003B3BEA12